MNLLVLKATTCEACSAACMTDEVPAVLVPTMKHCCTLSTAWPKILLHCLNPCQEEREPKPKRSHSDNADYVEETFAVTACDDAITVMQRPASV